MKLLREKSSRLPDLKFKNIIKLDENLKTSRLSYKTKIKIIKERQNLDADNKIFIYQDKNKSNKKNDINNKTISNEKNDNEKYNINELKGEIELLQNQLNEEKIKSEVLKQIAEEENKKHILYKKKFQTIILSNGELMDEIKTKNNNRITFSYIEDKNKENINNIYPIKYINNCNSVKNIKNRANNSDINSFLLTSRQFCNSPTQTIQVNKIDIIKDAILNKKIKLKKFKKENEENSELKEKNIQKDILIEKLTKKIQKLNEENLKLLNDNKKNIKENIRLKEEIDFKNKEIESIKIKLNEELDINQKNINKLKEIKDINEKFLNKLLLEREQNKKLKKIILNYNKKEDQIKIEEENIILNENNNKRCKNKLGNSLDKNSIRSLEINGLKDISNISCIEIKQQMGQYEQEDITLKEIFQKKLFDLDEIKYDNNEKK